MSYLSLDYDLALSHGCQTIEDVEAAELSGVLPGGCTQELDHLFPTDEEFILYKALREFLFVENDFITEAQLVDSYDFPDLLRSYLSDLGTDVVSYFFLTFLPSFQEHG